MVCPKIDTAYKEKVSIWDVKREKYHRRRNKRIYMTFLGAVVLSVMCMMRIPFLVIVKLFEDTNSDGALLTTRNMLLFMSCYLALGIIPSVMALRGFSKNRPSWILFFGGIVHWMYLNIPCLIIYELIQDQSDYFLHLLKKQSRDNCSSTETIIQRVHEMTTVHVADLWQVPWHLICLPPLVLFVVLPPIIICVLLMHYLIWGVSYEELEHYVLEVLQMPRQSRYQKNLPPLKEELAKEII